MEGNTIMVASDVHSPYLLGDQIDMANTDSRITASQIRESFRRSEQASREAQREEQRRYEELIRHATSLVPVDSWTSYTADYQPRRANPFAEEPSRRAKNSSLYGVFKTVILREGSYEQFIHACGSEEVAHKVRMKMCEGVGADEAETYFVRSIGELHV